MIRSMTGFGRAKIEAHNRQLTVEVRTLNHRYLDINLRLPRNISFLEEKIRELIKSYISRGRVDIYINYINMEEGSKEVELNRPLVSGYISCLRYLAEDYGIENDLSLSSLVNIPEIFIINEKEEDAALLEDMMTQVMKEALQAVVDMRAAEGEKLREDVLQRARTVRSMLAEVEERAPLVVEEYRERLKMRLRELLESTDLDEARFNSEVAYFAERCNISEEIVRLHSHLDQLGNIMDMQGPVGRKLDFLVQEMNREVNTIGSKASDLEISRLVIAMKSEIEKIREQIQNIE